MHELQQDRVNRTNEFIILKHIPPQIINNAQQPPPPPTPPPTNNMGINNKESSEYDFLSCLKRPLTTRIIAKVIPRKKSVKFTKFDGIQDPKMHVHKFHEDAIEYMHDQYLLAKLFSYSLKDEALKWYF